MVKDSFEYRQYCADWAQLVTDEVNIILPATKVDVSQDERLLIPIVSHHKIGFVNRKAQYIVKPCYDKYWGDAFSVEDVIRVGKRYSYGLPGWKEGQILTYDRDKWGVIDSTGKVLVEPEYKSISISDDNQLFTIEDFKKGYCVKDRNGNVIVPYGEYDQIEGFTKGYARVKMGHRSNGYKDSGSKFGIINTSGELVLPIEYDDIWRFHNGKDLPFTTIVKDGIKEKFYFETGAKYPHRIRNYHSGEAYERHYGEFAGSYAQDVMGVDDDTINDAFEGDPDAYWNID